MSTTTRLSLGLTALTLSVLSSAQLLGIYPDPTEAVLTGRLKLCQAIGVHAASAVREEVDIDSIAATITSLVEHNREVLSVGVREVDGALLAEAGDHETSWKGAMPDDQSSPTHVRIPIIRGEERWGTVEVAFGPLYGEGVWGWLKHPVIGMMLFMGVNGFVAYMFYLRRTLKMLNPKSVIPERIQKMLNTMAEGIVVIDKGGLIIMSNDGFGKIVGKPTADLSGKAISSLGWQHVAASDEAAGEDQSDEYPWVRSMSDGETHTGVTIKFPVPGKMVRTLTVNSAAILGSDGKPRGALATFSDMTVLAQQHIEIRKSRDQIAEQNKKLDRLAYRDVLTDCFNRRSLFEQFDVLWKLAHEKNKDIGLIMFDIDKFKSINDTHGHAKGDEVLKEVAKAVQDTASETSVVYRYGGEEFCVLMRHGTIDEAAELAEKMRKAIQERHAGGLPVTSSFGVSSKIHGAKTPQELMEQADKALYAAKHGGRNRVERYDKLPPDLPEEHAKKPEEHAPAATAQPEPAAEAEDVIAIPFQAVTGLLAALSHRDAATGQHSKRVADLCVMVAQSTMSAKDCFVLEVAALLHDLGKLGIPDAILLKPTPLTQEEWQVMRLHDEMGVQIINSAFASVELTEVVRTYHAWFNGNSTRPDMPAGQEIVPMARILAIADAFDAMVSDRPYRKAVSMDQAFAELRRWSGIQFDPEWVENFVAIVEERYRDKPVYTPVIAPHLALELGQAMERVLAVFDGGDRAELPPLVTRLKFAAARSGTGKMIELADHLEKMATSGVELQQITVVVQELVELCQSISPVSPTVAAPASQPTDATAPSPGGDPGAPQP